MTNAVKSNQDKHNQEDTGVNSSTASTSTTTITTTTIVNSEIIKEDDEGKAIERVVNDEGDAKDQDTLVESKGKERIAEEIKIPSPSTSSTSPTSSRISSPTTSKPQLTNINIEATATSTLSKDDARELAKNFKEINLSPPIETTTTTSTFSSTPADIEESEEEWLLKEIHWPPLPPPPSDSLQDSTSLQYSESPITISIITQNKNGPCSLIALCNILILRYDIIISSSKKSVSYTYLSSLVADYLLKIYTTSLASPLSEMPPQKSFIATQEDSKIPNLDLAGVLSILPKTRYGLQLNVKFDSIFGFSSGSTSAATPTTPTFNPSLGIIPSTSGSSPELSLFSLCRIPLVHGWLVSSEEEELFNTLVLKAGDYDNAVMMVVKGSELSGGISTSDLEFGEMEEEVLVREIERRSQWTEREQEKVKDGEVIRNFLESTSTQLSYPGLIQLTTQLQPGSLSALFRNSHLSVLYRRPSPISTVSPPLPINTSSQLPTIVDTTPELYTLVTDSGIVSNYPEIVWESLEDVDGSGTRFWNGALRKSDISTSSRRSEGRERDGSGSGTRETREGRENSDRLLAQQLQQEYQEYDRRESQREYAQPQVANRERDGHISSSSSNEARRNQPNVSGQVTTGDNQALIKRREFERKKREREVKKEKKKEKNCCIS